MNIDVSKHVTADGFDYRVLATDLPGELPYAIYVNGQVAQLDKDLRCPANAGYSLTEARNVQTRYFNVYRAADGAFCMGSRAFTTDDARRATRDSERAIFALKVEFNESIGEVKAERV